MQKQALVEINGLSIKLRTIQAEGIDPISEQGTEKYNYFVLSSVAGY
jgi:hypothetical protein